MDYKLKSGKVINEADIDSICELIEKGRLDHLGKQRDVIIGRPRLSNENLVTITFKVPESDAQRIRTAVQKEGVSRSAFLRRAACERVEEVLG